MGYKKKICIMTEYFPPYIGGGQVNAYEFAKALGKEFEFHVITNGLEGCKPYEIIDNVHIHRIGVIGELRSPWRRFVYVVNAIRVGRKMHRELDFDLIHAHVFAGAFAGYILSKISKIPIICTVHGIHKLRGDAGRFANLWQKIIVGLSYDAVIAVSKDTESRILDLGKSPKALVVIPNGVDMEIFHPDEPSRVSLRKRLHVDNDELLIGFFGRIVRGKGIDILIESMPIVLKHMPNVKLLIMGDGDLKNSMEERILDLRLDENVMIKNPVPHQEVAQFYCACDLIVIPSRSEAFSLSALEAMASGVPLVASNVGGLREIVHHSDNGWLVEANSISTLSEAIVKVLSENELRHRLIENGVSFVSKRFSWVALAKHLRDIYLTLIEKSDSTNFVFTNYCVNDLSTIQKRD